MRSVRLKVQGKGLKCSRQLTATSDSRRLLVGELLHVESWE